MKAKSRLSVLLAASLFISGCLSTRSHYTSSSVVNFLYPDGSQQVVEQQTPHLQLPLRVGIAFTPGDEFRRAEALDASARQALLDSVAERFRSEAFVDTIEVIPDGYLRVHGGFDNVDQLAALFNLDVLALVSYDQHRFTDEGLASLAYWTLVGAYVVPGERNTTHTLMDAVLYDINSRSLLFRAPGSSTVKGRSTPVAASRALRQDSSEGFDLASAELIDNLDAELTRFKARVRDKSTSVTVSGRDGYSGEGAGSLDGLTLLLALGALAYARRRKANSRRSSCCR